MHLSRVYFLTQEYEFLPEVLIRNDTDKGPRKRTPWLWPESLLLSQAGVAYGTAAGDQRGAPDNEAPLNH